MKKKILIIGTLLSLLLALGWFNRDILSPKIANFSFIGIDGVEYSLLNNAPVLVNMWTSDCVACDKEMPQLKALHNAYDPHGFRVIGIALSYDKLPAIKNYIKYKQLNFPVVYDKDALLASYFGKVNVTPTSFLLDSKGRILKKVIGEPNWQEWELEIQKQLGI